MKKNNLFLLGILGMALVFGLVLIGYLTDDSNNGNGGGTPSVISVTVDPATVSVDKGETQAFKATVTGENNPVQTVKWSIVETNKAAGTSISDVGVLTVAAAEALTSLTVKATSTLDPSKSVEAKVTTSKPTLTPAIIDNESALEAYIKVLSETEKSPITIKFSGEISSANLRKVCGVANSTNTYVILDLSKISTLSARAIGQMIKGLESSENNIKGLVLPDGLTSIGAWVFSNCLYLESITLPDGLISIGEQAFSNCLYLTSITLPDGLISIGKWAFSNSVELGSITLPASLRTIGDYAFSHCFKLTSVEFKGTSVAIENTRTFPCSMNSGDLKTAYENGKQGTNRGVAGVYTRNAIGNSAGTWTRQKQ